MFATLRLTLTGNSQWYHNDAGEPTLCPDFVKRKLGRTPKVITLKGSSRPQVGYKRVRVQQYSSSWDEHFIGYERSRGCFACIFKPLCSAIASLKGFKPKVECTAFVWYKISSA